MSAGGDIVYVGNSGSIEYVPRVNYVPDYNQFDGDTIIKQLVRTIRCRQQVVDQLRRSLKNDTALTLPTITAAGAAATQEYLGDWRLTRINETGIGAMFSLLTVTYECRASRVFEFNLPEGVTITSSAGVHTLAYNGTPLQSWDSGRGASTSGLTLLHDQRDWVELWRLFMEPENFVARGEPDPAAVYSLFADGVLIEQHQVYARNMTGARARRTYRELLASKMYDRQASVASVSSAGELTYNDDAINDEVFTPEEIAELVADSGAESAYQRIRSQNSSLTYPNEAGDQTYVYLRRAKVAEVWGYYTRTVGPVAYDGKARGFQPEWELNGNDLRIHVAGATLMNWSVEGL